LFEDFEAGSALPRDNRRIVEARYDCRPAIPGEATRNLLSAFGPAVVEDDLGAFGPRAIDFHRRSVRRHDDNRADAEPFCGNRHAARVIPRRKGDNAAFALPGRELEQAVGRASQLERAAGLQTLAFEHYAQAVDLGFKQRCPFDQTGNALVSSENILTRNS
jgi:hypothetical protein